MPQNIFYYISHKAPNDVESIIKFIHGNTHLLSFQNTKSSNLLSGAYDPAQATTVTLNSSSAQKVASLSKVVVY